MMFKHRNFVDKNSKGETFVYNIEVNNGLYNTTNTYDNCDAVLAVLQAVCLI